MGRWLSEMEPRGAALMRLVLGAAMVFHGWQKVVPAHGFGHGDPLHTVRQFCGFVATLGLPYWLGYVSAGVELMGGALLLLGLLTRLAAFLIVGNMLVALFAVNLHHGYAGSEYTLALLALGTMLVFTGGGAASVDHRLGLS